MWCRMRAWALRIEFLLQTGAWEVLEHRSSRERPRRITRLMSPSPILSYPCIGEYHVRNVRTPESMDAMLKSSTWLSWGFIAFLPYTQAKVQCRNFLSYINRESINMLPSTFGQALLCRRCS